MTENTIHIRATRAQLRQALAQIPAAASGGGATADAMMTRCGMALLGRIKQAFIAKSRGGMDEAGDSWQPLSPETIAYSKTRSRGRGGRTKAEKGRPSRPSQALSANQQARWWKLYRQGLAMFRLGPDPQASAARRAWAILKREGAQTLLDKYGHRQVDILRDTGLLLNSLSPGVASPNAVFRIGHGEVIVGTNRKGAAAHHHGVPGRLPQRRLWPEPRKWPATWWTGILEQLRQGLVDITASIIKGLT